jgi:hypothetical protein
VRLRAPHGPAAQAAQGELGQQLVHVLHHRPQAAGRLAGQLVEQRQVAAQHVGVAQALGRQRQRRQDQGDDAAGRVRGELHHRLDDVWDDVFADLFGHARDFLHVSQHQVLPPVQRAHGAHALQVIVQAARRHHPLRLVVGRVQRLGVFVVVFVQALDVV